MKQPLTLLSALALCAALLIACSSPEPEPYPDDEPLPSVTPVPAKPTPTRAPAPRPSPSAAPAAGEVTLRVPAEVQEVFDLDCIRCHRAQRPKGRLNLEADQAYAALVERKSTQATRMALVAPGEPKESYLLHKMRGTHLDVGGHGARMPRNGTWGPSGSLSDGEVARVEAWIEAGAPSRE